MAVRFKVPKSPRRSIFEIDEFLGVDLTNSGTNIDEVRSPNALNMVRYVPGKVRKRMGYEEVVTFSDGTNINRASNTSDEYEEFELSSTISLLYKLEEPMEEFTLSFDYISEEDFELCGETVTASDDGNALIEYDGNSLEEIVATGDGTVQIKNFFVTHKYDSSTYEWKEAPEDNGKEFVYNESSDLTINGAFNMSLDDSAIETNPSGINRAKNTQSYYEYYEGNKDFELYDRIPCGQRILIQFDYTGMQGTYSVYAGTEYYPIPIDGITFSKEFVIADGETIDKISVKNGTSIQISNLIVAYVDKFQEVKWNIAPEEDGRVFDLSNVYNSDDKNYSRISGVSDKNISVSQFATSYTYEMVVDSNSFDGTIANFYSNIKTFSLVDRNGKHYTSGIGGTVTTTLVSHEGNEYVAETDATLEKNHFLDFLVGLEEGDYIEKVKYRIKWTKSISLSKVSIVISDVKINLLRTKLEFNLDKDYKLYHVGKKMFMKRGNRRTELISSDMENGKSMAWQLGDKLYILDGNKLSLFDPYDDYFFGNASEKASIPRVSIANKNTGGGVSLDAFNLLQPGFETGFMGNGSSKTFQLPLNVLDETEVTAYELIDGVETKRIENTDFTVDREQGTVTFNTAPKDATSSGEDNLFITAYKSIYGYADRINKCKFGMLYGMGGSSDRLLISGNPAHRNWDFLSEAWDGTYFPDTGYAAVGDETSAIVGYSRINNFLATHKDNRERFMNAIVRECTTVNRDIYLPGSQDVATTIEDPQLRITNILNGEGAVGRFTFNSLQTEPIFLTRSGIFAITAQDLTGEKYGQNRSFYLNGELLNEENLEEAYSVVYNDMYILSLNNKLYILDGLQPVRTDRSEPYASRQYVAYLCDNVPANVIWRDDDKLLFGTVDGKINRFFTDVDDPDSYNDNGEPIYCCWETPDLDGKLFYKNKTFRYFAVRMMKAIRTSCKLYAAKRGVWSFIKEDASSGLVFDFDRIDFRKFSFSTDNSDKVVHTKIRVKKVDKARFKVENDKLGEPFGLFNLALEYIESGNYKG